MESGARISAPLCPLASRRICDLVLRTSYVRYLSCCCRLSSFPDPYNRYRLTRRGVHYFPLIVPRLFLGLNHQILLEIVMQGLKKALGLMIFLSTGAVAGEHVTFDCGGSVDYPPQCMPFGKDNLFVQQGAVDIAKKDKLAVGAIVEEDMLIAGDKKCDYKWLEWVVNKSPVTSIADLTFDTRGMGCMGD
jgi:hypothetical protein